MKRWTLSDLKAALSCRTELKAWTITTEALKRRERYFMAEEKKPLLDQDRTTEAYTTHIRIAVRKHDADRQGEIHQKLFHDLPLEKQLDEAISAALQTDHESWDYPEKQPSSIEMPQTADPEISEDLDRAADRITARIHTAIAMTSESLFNSAELFVSNHDFEVQSSNGFSHRYAQSRIYLEAAFSYAEKNEQGETQSDEFLTTAWAVDSDSLQVEKLFHESAQAARHSLAVRKPTPGRFHVVVDASVLAMLLHGQIKQLTAVNRYNHLPFLETGSELIPDLTGDALTVTLDPGLRYGADAGQFSDLGVAQHPIRLIEKNKIVASIANPQFAQYEDLPVTPTRGDLVVESGTSSLQELLGSYDQVLEILQFSSLFPDSNRGTFSSEIRLARLHDRKTGAITYIKGGSLSGSIRQNFKGLRLSKERTRHVHFDSERDDAGGQGYQGPAYALLSDVSVAG